MNRQIILTTLILSIIFINIIQADELISDSGVKYDSEILEVLESSQWAPVIVKVKDVTNISVSFKDSIEIQESKDEERKRILGNITDSVLNTLLEDEFQLDGKFISGYGFSGKITKEGFDKLLVDQMVGKIFFDGELYIVTIAKIKNIFIQVIKIIFVVLLIIIIYKLIKNKIHKKNKKIRH